MLRRFIYLLTLVCILVTLVSPVQAKSPALTPRPKPQVQAGTQNALEAALSQGIDPEAFPPAAPLVVVFSEAMDAASAQPALLTFPYLAGKESWDADAKTLTFQPQGGFPGGKEMEIFLNDGLRSKSGQAFQSTQHWALKVLAAPRVVSRHPVDMLVINRQPTLTINFDRPMMTESLQAAIQLEPAVPFTLKVDEKAVDIAINQTLDPGAQFKLILTTDAKDTSGAALDRTYAWTYRVMPFETDYLDCSKQRIQLDFNYSILPESFQQNITVDPPVQGKWQSQTSQEVFFIESQQPLEWAQRYTISFKAPLQDAEGNPLPPTGPLTCTVTPPFSVTPENAETYEGSFDKVAVTFQVAMDAESVKNAFSIQPDVPGTLAYVEGKDSGTLTFVPKRPFLPNTFYTVTLAASMRTAAGQAILADPYQHPFHLPPGWIEYGSPQPTFTDHGPNIQVVDADAPRYLQISTRGGVEKLYFDAYPVDLPRFVQLYRQYFGSTSPSYGMGSKTQTIDTQGLQIGQSFAYTVKQEGVTDLLLPEKLPNGLYVLNMRADSGLLDQIFLVLSRSTITAKLTNARLFAWTTDINGPVVPEAEMRLYTMTGELMREGKANKEAVYEVSVPIDSKPMLIAARDAQGDITVAGLSDEWEQKQWAYDSYDYWYDGAFANPRAARLMAYIFTDRPIYRPGDIVHYKAILRQDDDVHFSLLDRGQPVKVRLLDARDNLLEEHERDLNEFGTLNGDFTLSPDGNLGDYHIEVQALNETTRQAFSVEEYHKPDYSVTIQPAKKDFIEGEAVDLMVEARYFLGQPVANANVTLKFFRYYDQPIVITGKTDADGRYVFTTSARLGDVGPWFGGYGYDLSSMWGSSLVSGFQPVEASVSDGSNQPVSAATTYHIYSAAEGLELDTHGYFKTPGQPFSVDVRTVTYDGNPVASRNVSVVIYGRSSDRYSYRWDKEISKVEVVTDAAGRASAQVMLDSVGDYKIAAVSADSSGTELYNNDWVTAYQPSLAWDFAGSDEFSIHAEKDAYKPYEPLKLLIRSTFSGPALLTFERGSVIHHDVINLTAPLTEIQTEVIPEYAPNVYVTINAWQDEPYKAASEKEYYTYWLTNRPNSKLRMDSVELKVNSTDKLLDVAITSSKTTFAPREQAQFTIQVSHAGAPVQAELAVGLVDEAIYSLKDEPWKAIYRAFYDPRPHMVSTYHSMAIRRYLIDEGGKGGGGTPSPSLDAPRADFPDTAVWLPTIVTDAQGKAVINLTLPDSLTRWRLTVRAVTRSTQVGQATYTIQTQQDIALRPAFPSVVTEGDQFALSAYAHNLSETPQTLTVELDAPELEVLDGGKQTVTVKPGESVPLRWEVQAHTPGTVQVTLLAASAAASSTDSSGDAIRLPIAVQPRATLTLDQRSGQFSGKLDVPVFLPPTATSASSIHLELSHSIAGGALSGMESLIGYPYGCVEQTMSKALPNAVVGRTLKRLELSNPELEARLPELIDAGVKRLYGMQHYDGGWGWWTNDDTDAYQTAWVVFGLSVTMNAGYPVDPKVIHRGARALKGLLGLDVPYEKNEMNGWDRYNDVRKAQNAEKLNPKLQAFMLYSLAIAGEGDGPTEAVGELALELYENYPALDAFSQSALALALHTLRRDEEAGQIVNELESTAYRSDSEAYWPGYTEDGEYHQKTMSSEVRTAALALEAIQVISPESSLIGEIVRYLMNHKTASGWGTTNETAFTLLALTGQMENAKSIASPTSYRVLVNGKEVAQADWKVADQRVVVELPSTAMVNGLNRLEVISDEQTPLYYSLSVHLYEDAAKAQPDGNVNIQREYLDAGSGKELTSFTEGQLVQVRLTVTAPDAQTAYVMVEDHLPGGLEALNEGLNTTGRLFNEQSLSYYEYYYYSYGADEYFKPFTWREWGYNNKEIHDGRVTFFITSMNDNTITLQYYARALRTGTFTALPAEVSAMYDLNAWGRSDTAVVEVK